MMDFKLTLSSGALLVLCLLGSFSCDRQTEGADEGTNSTQDEAASDDSRAANSKSSAGACRKLSDKLCAEVGQDDPTCESAKVTLEVLSESACSAGLRDFAATKSKLKNQGKKCDQLMQKICAKVGPESESCGMVKEKTKAIPPARCQTMLDHVDEIVAELQQQERANQPLSTQQQTKIAAGDAPSFGPANAKVTVVEFSDFECPYCSRAAVVTTQLREKYSDNVRVVFRQFPLSFHQNAKAAAAASLAAHAQGKFWQFHDKLFQNQRSLDRASLEGYAKELGLDLGKFKAALDNSQNQQRIEGDLELGNEVAVQGTPTMFVNGKRVANPTDFGEVSSAIETALGS